MRPGRNIPTGLSDVVQPQVRRTAPRPASHSTRFVLHRRLLWLVFMLVGLVGSPGIGLAGPIIVETEDTGGGAAMPPELQNQYVAARLFDEVFVQQKPDVCGLLMTANAVTHTPAGDVEGPAGFEQYVAGVWTASPAASFTFEDGVIDGHLVTVHWTLSGGQADGAELLDGTAILRFEQNMIAETWIEYGSVVPAGQVIVTPAAPETCPPCREP